MAVSILVPIYNVEKYIERCARSLFEQTYPDIEYIFVNDCTPDNSIGILKNVVQDYPHREEHIRIITHEKNRGLAAARNTAVENCQTDFLMHVDSDDWLEVDAVQRLVDEQQKGNYDIVTGNARVIYPNRNERLRHNEPKDKQTLIQEYCKPTISHVIWGRLIRTSLYKDNGIHALEGYNIGEDHQVIPQLLYYARSFSSIDDIIYNYDRTNENSYMKQSNQPQKFGNKVLQDLKAFEVLRSFFKHYPQESYYAHICEEMATYCMGQIKSLAEYRLKDVFIKTWAYFDDIDNVYKRNIKENMSPISLVLKKNYYIYKLIRLFRHL